MKLTWLPDAERHARRIAIGTFDGVHLGHREVIAGADTVLTFDPHPTRVVHPESAPQLLTDLDRKSELIAGLGVSELVVIPFDGAFSAQSAEHFIDHVLVGQLGASHVSIGENFRFGSKARGTPDLLRADGRFEVRVERLLEVGGRPVSSSRIRALLSAGDVVEAAGLLGAPFELAGTVVHGDKRGRELGFPTANLVPDPAFVLPAHGVYACVTGDGTPAAVSIGVRPTFTTGRANWWRHTSWTSRVTCTGSGSSCSSWNACAVNSSSTGLRRWSTRCTVMSCRRAASSPGRSSEREEC